MNELHRFLQSVEDLRQSSDPSWEFHQFRFQGQLISAHRILFGRDPVLLVRIRPHQEALWELATERLTKRAFRSSQDRPTLIAEMASFTQASHRFLSRLSSRRLLRQARWLRMPSLLPFYRQATCKILLRQPHTPLHLAVLQLITQPLPSLLSHLSLLAENPKAWLTIPPTRIGPGWISGALPPASYFFFPTRRTEPLHLLPYRLLYTFPYPPLALRTVQQLSSLLSPAPP